MELVNAQPETNPAQPTGLRVLDLTGEICPMTFVKAKIHLERLKPGEELELVLLSGEQIQNVPRSIKEDGHKIEKVCREGDRFRLTVRRAG